MGLPKDLPMKLALGSLLALSFAQYAAKVVILSTIDKIKDKKKKRRENI
jgi:hypothetical protein